jgi:hypothetical protein
MAKVEAVLGWTAPTRLEAGLDRVLALAVCGECDTGHAHRY